MDGEFDPRRCPCCRGKLEAGHIFGTSSTSVYWLPEGVQPQGVVLTAKRINDCGGFVLGETIPVGFIAKSRPISRFCRQCGLILTMTQPAK